MPVFPFTAVVGQDRMKLALILNAINPLIGGVLIRGEKGTAKSTAVRALAQVLPEMDVVADCPYGCPPDDPRMMCANCYARLRDSEQLPVTRRKMRVVDLPLNASEDRVVGSLNLERALTGGERRFEPGLLAQANRNLLYVDEINLLDDHIADVLLDAAAMGVNIVEREGVSVQHPARCILVGTMNPEEGYLRPQLLDRFGLAVDVQALPSLADRLILAERRESFDATPAAFLAQWARAEADLAARIHAARGRLPQVQLPYDLRREVASLAIRLCLHGHRADLTIVKAARALAAWEGRDEVVFDDVQTAVDLALPHRFRGAQRSPVMQGILRPSEEEMARLRRQMEKESEDGHDPYEALRKAREATRRIARDREQFDRLRLRLLPDRVERDCVGRRTPSQVGVKRGRYTRSRPQAEITDLALDATVRAAAPYQRQRGRTDGGALRLRPTDLRQKRREHKASNLFVFVVDGSGSVMDQERMSATKGAVLTFLESAYQKRDRVALVVFQGYKASVVLPPTSGVELAVHALDELEVGGFTPLTHAILEGLRLVKQEQLRDATVYPLLIFFTDGIGNITLEKKANSVEEAQRAGGLVRREGIPALVIDPGSAFNPDLWRGQWSEARIQQVTEQIQRICPELAHEMGASYYKIETLRRGETLKAPRPRRLR